jgi:hypothetical protein
MECSKHSKLPFRTQDAQHAGSLLVSWQKLFQEAVAAGLGIYALQVYAQGPSVCMAGKSAEEAVSSLEELLESVRDLREENASPTGDPTQPVLLLCVRLSPDSDSPGNTPACSVHAI